MLPLSSARGCSELNTPPSPRALHRRRRKFYALRPAGVVALRQAYRAFTAMVEGLQSRLEMK
jgi:DNA-binding PadR family transcriptional regulator